MKKLIYITFILFVTISCSNKPTTNNKVEIVDFSNLDFKEEVELSKKFNYKSIILETNDSCLIGDLTKVICLNNRLYILDQTTAKTLFVFNVSGKFLFKIEPTGNSYKECNRLEDFNIYKQNIVLLSSFDRKLLFYDLNGKYIKTLKLENYGNRNLKFLSDSLFVTTDSQYGCEIIDYWNLKGKIIKSFKNVHSIKYNIPKYPRPLTANINNNNTYVNFNKNDTIFKISKENYSSVFFIDFGSKHFPIEKFKDAKKLIKEFKSNKYYMIYTYSITNNYIYADISGGKSIYSVIYNRKTHTKIAGKMFKFNGYFINTISGDLQNGFICYMAPIQINYINKKKNGKMFKNVKKSDNPVIVLVTEKDKTLDTDNNKE